MAADEQALIEIFTSVKYNLDIIYRELLNLDYVFKSEINYNFEKPLSNPLPDVEILLNELDIIVKPFGYVPESLKYFYRIVGSCNFAWDMKKNDEPFRTYADPLQVCALDDLVSYMRNGDWLEIMTEEGMAYIELSADYYHKDDTSGGMPYSIAITPEPSIDSSFLYEEHDTTFINYLRISMENCGFSRITKEKNDYQKFFDKVKPQLKQI